ncbi:MAG: polysaccharide biosynthesis protein [Firmicutes bacterium]|nr:polysaccharide biosynthesis protein [Bacillota bacterium]
MSTQGYSFLRGALLLTMAGLVSRLIGSVARIILPRVIGSEAIGLLQMVYPVYTIFLIISISGIPLAIAKLISEQIAYGRPDEARRIFRLARTLLFGTGAVLSAGLYLFAPVIAERFISDPGAALPLRALSPAVFLLSASAAFRGYFQGIQEMRPSAITQVIEQATRVSVMIILALHLMDRGVEWAATGAALGTVAGGLLTLALLIIFYLFLPRPRLPRQTRPDRLKSSGLSAGQIVREIYRLSVPIVLGTLIFPISHSLDAAIVPRRLQGLGYTVEVARALYGQFTGMAMALIHFPCVLTIGLAQALIPAISEAWARRDYTLLKERIANSLWLAAAVSIPSSVGLYVLAEPICTLLFKLPEVAIPLQAAAAATIFIALAETSISVLQGVGQVLAPVRYLVCGALAKMILTYSLTGLPQFGIKGAAIASVLGFALPALLNFKGMYKWVGYLPNLLQLAVKPAIAAGVMGYSVGKLYPWFEAISVYLFSYVRLPFTVAAGLLAAVIIYLLALVAIGGVPPRFLALLGTSRSRILSR